MSCFSASARGNLIRYRRTRLYVHLLTVLLAGIATPAAAQQSIPLTLAAAEQLALSGEPGHDALLSEAEALAERAVAAGELPDPMLRAGVANFPIEYGGFSTEGMTQAQIGLRQAFPPSGTRAAERAQMLSLSSAKTHAASARERRVLTSVRRAWLEARYWQQANDIVRESRPFFADLVVVTRSLYAVGRRDQQDVLSAELELTRLDDRLLEIGRSEARARATLSEWVGNAANRPLADLPAGWGETPAMDTLLAELDDHPLLAASASRIDAGAAGVRHADASYRPAWSVDLGYGYRDGLLPNGAPRSDFVSLTFTVDLPLFRKNRQDRRMSAALHERRAAEAEDERLSRELASQLRTEYANWRDLGRRIDLYENSIRYQAEDRTRAALAAYQSETGDFADVMRARIDELNAHLDHVRLQTERAQSYAVLANLGGLAP